MSVYDFEVKTQDGQSKSLRDYEGKILLIINTATRCGFTPQYKELQALYEKYKDQGLEILDFPSNQFMQQAPESDSEIGNFCQVNFGISFPQFAKVDVLGDNRDPLFKYLEDNTSFKGFGGLKGKVLNQISKQNAKKQGEGNIGWNFTKFLIGRNGEIVARFEPTEDIKKVEDKIKELI
ncbi:MAG: glutathione peroxidase [Finegoldia sp.]|nr:glutathione peroxidase [Finegoldia sp.]